METLNEVCERQSEQLEYLNERVRVLSESEQELKEQNRSLLVQREKKLQEFQKSEDQNDELRLELRQQTKRAEDMVTMNATLIASRNSVQIARDQAITSCRLSNRLRDVEHTELVQQRARVLHLTGRILDAATLLHRLLRAPNFETVQHAREFILIIKNETEGYTLTGPGDMPLMHAKIDLLKEDGTPLEPGPLPAPEPGVPVTRPATDGTPVVVHPDFAKSYDAAPGLWQGTLDSAAEDAKRAGLNLEPVGLSENDKRALMQLVVDAPAAPDQPSGAVGLLDVAEPLTPDHDACRDPNCPGHAYQDEAAANLDMPF